MKKTKKRTLKGLHSEAAKLERNAENLWNSLRDLCDNMGEVQEERKEAKKLAKEALRAVRLAEEHQTLLRILLPRLTEVERKLASAGLLVGCPPGLRKAIKDFEKQEARKEAELQDLKKLILSE